jgi:hypothetical protein
MRAPRTCFRHDLCPGWPICLWPPCGRAEPGATSTTCIRISWARQLATVTTASGHAIAYGCANNRPVSVTVDGTSVLASALYEPFDPIVNGHRILIHSEAGGDEHAREDLRQGLPRRAREERSAGGGLAGAVRSSILLGRPEPDRLHHGPGECDAVGDLRLRRAGPARLRHAGRFELGLHVQRRG